MQYKLIKIKSNHNRLRTNEIIGEIDETPKVGIQLVMWSEPLTEGAAGRRVNTNIINDVRELPTGWTFTTESGSEYQLDRIQ